MAKFYCLAVLLVLQSQVCGLSQTAPNSQISAIRALRQSNAPQMNDKSSSIDVVVSTSLGSKFLNKRKKCTLSANATIANLKEKLAIVYPGTPPIELQRLYFGLKYLADDMPVANITSMRPVPLLMDMLSGVGSFQRNLSIADTLEAYAALLTQEMYVNEKLASLLAPIDDSNTLKTQLETSRFRQIFDTLNKTMFSGHEVQIAKALERERNPELITDEVSVWRGAKQPLTAFQHWLAHQFYFSRNTLRALFTYTAMLVIVWFPICINYIFAACIVLWWISVWTECWCDCFCDALDISLETNAHHYQGNTLHNVANVM